MTIMLDIATKSSKIPNDEFYMYLTDPKGSNKQLDLHFTNVTRFVIFYNGLLCLDQNTKKTVNRCFCGGLRTWLSKAKAKKGKTSLLVSPNVFYLVMV